MLLPRRPSAIPMCSKLRQMTSAPYLTNSMSSRSGSVVLGCPSCSSGGWPPFCARANRLHALRLACGGEYSPLALGNPLLLTRNSGRHGRRVMDMGLDATGTTMM